MSADYRIPDPSKPAPIELRCWYCSRPIPTTGPAVRGHESCVRSGGLYVEIDYDDNLVAR